MVQMNGEDRGHDRYCRIIGWLVVAGFIFMTWFRVEGQREQVYC